MQGIFFVNDKFNWRWLRVYCLNFILLFFLISAHLAKSQSGNCDPTTPFFNVNLTGNPNGTWTSTPSPRVGNCCGTSAPDKCVEFKITLDPSAVAINFQIVSGAVPSGALFYQINCGPQIPVGTAICLNGPGPYTLTFCKPGNNINSFAITSIAGPSLSPNDTVGNGCSTTLYSYGLITNSITWTSIYPGAVGSYNSYLSCLTGCDSSIVTGTSTAPPYVDYLVCGTPLAGVCATATQFCDTIRVYFTPPITNTVTPNPAIFCETLGGLTLTGTPGGGLPPYTYAWTNGANGSGTVVGNSTTYYATASGNYSFIVYDKNYPGCPAQITTVPVTISPLPVVNAGPDQNLCGTTVQLNGSVTGATGATWSGGSGTFSPSATTPNAVYTPSQAELNTGIVILTLTSTGNGACNAVSDQVIIHIAPPITVNINAPSYLCNGALATLTAQVSGGLGPYAYLWNTGQTSASINNMPAGSYTVVVTGSGGSNCTASAVVTINANPPIIVNTSPNNTISCSSTAVISASASGGTGTLTYNWSTGATTPSIVVGTGTYIVTVTDAVGCSATNSVNITASNSNLIVLVNQPSVLCYGTTAILTATASGGFGSYTYLWSNGASTNSITASAGNYCVTVTDAGGCTNTNCVTLTQNLPLNLSIPIPSTICNGSSTVLTANTTGGQAPYTYSWSNGQSTASITAIAGTYNLIVSDAIGCTKTTSITVNEASPIQLTSNNTMVSCNGGNNGTASVTATGGTPGYLYSWSPYGGSLSTASNLLPGTFSVTVTDAIGCSAGTTAIITQPLNLSATISNSNNVSCYNLNNGSATVTVNGGTTGYSYQWSPAGGTGANATNLAPGNYSIFVTDANGCKTTATTSIAQPTQLNAGLANSTSPSCFGGTNGSAGVNATGGTPSYTYSWMPIGGSGFNAINLNAGNYTVTITDAKGCQTTLNINITAPPVLQAATTGSVNVSCSGGTNGSINSSVIGGTAPYSYSWNTLPIQSSANAQNLPAGSYALTVTDAKGCTSTTNAVTITQPIAISLTLTQPAPISCTGTATIASSVTGGSPNYTYLWNNGSTSPTISVQPGTYGLLVSDANGCTANASVTVAPNNTTLAVTINNPPVLCNGATTNLQANASGGAGAYSYLWTNGSTNSNIIVGAGNYCVTITDANGCKANNCVSVHENSPLTAAIGTPPVICPGATTTVTAVATGGQAPYSYLWTTGQTGASVTLVPGSYTVTVSDATGSNCFAKASVTVKQESEIKLTINSTDVSCYNGNNGTAVVNASDGMPGYTYIWSPNGGINASAAGLAAGTYTVTVKDAIGCYKTATASIQQPNNAVSLSITSSPVLCYGQNNGAATLTGTGGTAPYSYYWFNNGSSNSIVNNLAPGTYIVLVSDNLGCLVKDSVTITSPNDISLTTTSTPRTCNIDNGSATVLASGGTGAYTYQWLPAGGNTTNAQHLPAGNYTVEVTDANGCKKQKILVIADIPSYITPNFTIPNNCLNAVSYFTNTSTVSLDSIVSYLWDFGEPSSGQANTSALQNPSHTYNTSGTFNASLTVHTKNGCDATYAYSLIIYPLPNVDFTISPTCVNSNSQFINSSTITSGIITNWLWNFGDPASGTLNSSILKDPLHSYHQSGIYSIILTATSDKGCINNSTHTQNITGAPLADFTYIKVCAKDQTIFSDKSIAQNNNIIAWLWDFGDGSNNSNQQNPTHIYQSDGTFNVQLIATASSYCKDTITIPVTVYPLPIANFSVNPVCVNSPSVFHNLSTISSGVISNYTWDFGNFTQPYYGINPNYTFSNSGNFIVTLIATSSYGCSNTYYQAIEVNPLPVANFGSSISCLNTPTQFTDFSLLSTGNLASWLWAYGDGTPVGNQQNPSHTYTTLGNYNVALVVTSEKGCKDTILKPISIYPAPETNFKIEDTSGCSNFCAKFINLSPVSPGQSYSWAWDFGDGFQSTLPSPDHCYNNSGLYTITLSAINANGCSNKKIKVNYIEVFPKPVAEFTYHILNNGDDLYNSDVNFINQSLGDETWTWNFHDPNDTAKSHLENPTHSFIEGGEYCITLIAENKFHCKDTATHCLRVSPEYTFFIPNAFTPGGSKGLNDTFGGVGTNIKQYDLWIFDRWGNLIFHSGDMSVRWDGRANGGKETAQEDVYVYLVKILDNKEDPHNFKGTVTLIK